MTMTRNLRAAALSIAAGGALTVLGVLFGPSGSASADPVGIHLDATTGTTVLPGRATPVPVSSCCASPRAASAARTCSCARAIW